MSEKNLWKDHYACQKPPCLGCLQQEVATNEYAFCSTEKKPTLIYDEWGKKLIHTFPDIYACQVYHWTIYQGQNKITPE